MAKRASATLWTGMTLHQCVVNSLENYVVFEICGYSRLVESGIPRQSVSALIKPVAEAVAKQWNFTPTSGS